MPPTGLHTNTPNGTFVKPERPLSAATPFQRSAVTAVLQRSTVTPFQNATYPRMFFAASLGSG